MGARIRIASREGYAEDATGGKSQGNRSRSPNSQSRQPRSGRCRVAAGRGAARADVRQEPRRQVSRGQPGLGGVLRRIARELPRQAGQGPVSAKPGDRRKAPRDGRPVVAQSRRPELRGHGHRARRPLARHDLLQGDFRQRQRRGRRAAGRDRRHHGAQASRGEPARKRAALPAHLRAGRLGSRAHRHGPALHPGQPALVRDPRLSAGRAAAPHRTADLASRRPRRHQCTAASPVCGRGRFGARRETLSAQGRLDRVGVVHDGGRARRRRQAAIRDRVLRRHHGAQARRGGAARERGALPLGGGLRE